MRRALSLFALALLSGCTPSETRVEQPDFAKDPAMQQLLNADAERRSKLQSVEVEEARELAPAPHDRTAPAAYVPKTY